MRIRSPSFFQQNVQFDLRICLTKNCNRGRPRDRVNLYKLLFIKKSLISAHTYSITFLFLAEFTECPKDLSYKKLSRDWVKIKKKQLWLFPFVSTPKTKNLFFNYNTFFFVFYSSRKEKYYTVNVILVASCSKRFMFCIFYDLIY